MMEQLPAHVRQDIVREVVAGDYKHVQLAMAVLAFLSTLLILILVTTRTPSQLNLAVLSLINILFWLFPLALQFAPASRNYRLIQIWIGLIATVIIAQGALYLFGPERDLILTKSWPPLVVFCVPLFQIIAKTFLLREHALFTQISFLLVFGAVAGTHALLYWDQAKSVFGMASLLTMLMIIGPLNVVLLHLQTKIQSEIKSRTAVRFAQEALIRKFDTRHGHQDAQLLEIQDFLSNKPSQSISLSFADVRAHSETYNALSGDFYFFKEGQRGELNFALCDAMGHSASAGMLTILAISVLESLDLNTTPLKWGGKIHDVLNAYQNSAFITGVFGKLWPSGLVQIVHYGHPASFIVPSSGTTPPSQVAGGGMALGMFDVHADAALEELQLQQGDTLVLWTDGFVEVSEQIGNLQSATDDFVKTMQQNASTASTILNGSFDKIYDAFGHSTFEDDISMVCIQYRLPSEIPS